MHVRPSTPPATGSVRLGALRWVTVRGQAAHLGLRPGHAPPLTLERVRGPGRHCPRAASSCTAATAGPSWGLSGCRQHGARAVTTERGDWRAPARPGPRPGRHVASAQRKLRGRHDLQPPVSRSRGAPGDLPGRPQCGDPGLPSPVLQLAAHWTQKYLKKCVRTKEDTPVVAGQEGGRRAQSWGGTPGRAPQPVFGHVRRPCAKTRFSRFISGRGKTARWVDRGRAGKGTRLRPVHYLFAQNHSFSRHSTFASLLTYP